MTIILLDNADFGCITCGGTSLQLFDLSPNSKRYRCINCGYVGLYDPERYKKWNEINK